MKFGIAILFALVSLSPSAHGAETDVVRVFDHKLKMTEKELMGYIDQASLGKYGFERTEEVSTVTDENGKKTTKRTIYFKVTDDCSQVKFWEGVLQRRLPKVLQTLKIFSTTVKEVEKRIAGRKTSSCTVGLEIHPNRCANEVPGKSVGKRRVARGCWICWSCSSASIVYAD